MNFNQLQEEIYKTNSKEELEKYKYLTLDLIVKINDKLLSMPNLELNFNPQSSTSYNPSKEMVQKTATEEDDHNLALQLLAADQLAANEEDDHNLALQIVANEQVNPQLVAEQSAVSQINETIRRANLVDNKFTYLANYHDLTLPFPIFTQYSRLVEAMINSFAKEIDGVYYIIQYVMSEDSGDSGSAATPEKNFLFRQHGYYIYDKTRKDDNSNGKLNITNLDKNFEINRKVNDNDAPWHSHDNTYSGNTPYFNFEELYDNKFHYYYVTYEDNKYIDRPFKGYFKIKILGTNDNHMIDYNNFFRNEIPSEFVRQHI